MKNFKRIASVVMVIMMMLSMMLPAMAASITINGAVENETYTAYKIFDATMSDANNTAVAYSITTADEWWLDILDYMKDEGAAEADANGNYTGNGLTLTSTQTDGKYSVTYDEDDFDVAAFAAFLITKKTGKTPAADAAIAKKDVDTGSVSATITIDSDVEGYYLVDSSLGALCALHTLNETVEVYEKNTHPSITKAVKASDEDTYDKNTSAYLGQTVNYQLTVNTGSNTYNDSTKTGVDENYVIVDTLPVGVTVTTETLNDAVKVRDIAWVAGTDNDYTVDVNGQTVTFTLLATGKLKNLEKSTNIIITYDAVLNASAEINNANTNTVELTYKEQSSEDEANVYTSEIVIDKYADGDSTKKLADATFILYKMDSTGNKLYYKEVTAQDNSVTYEWTSIKADATSKTTDDKGVAKFNLLDADTYYLEETVAPEGYNLLEKPVEVVIEETQDGNDKSVITMTIKQKTDNGYTPVTNVGIENNSGSILPSTGGIGTTIFYCAGAILAVGAFVLLITKKRMGKEV